MRAYGKEGSGIGVKVDIKATAEIFMGTDRPGACTELASGLGIAVRVPPVSHVKTTRRDGHAMRDAGRSSGGHLYSHGQIARGVLGRTSALLRAVDGLAIVRGRQLAVCDR